MKQDTLTPLHTAEKLIRVRFRKKFSNVGDRRGDDSVTIGSEWVHLRTCQECGGTRCCDSSPNRYPSKHAHAMKHPAIASAEPGERLLYCYPDDAFAEY